MADSEFPQNKIKNPLSEETRKERWHLLLTSAVSITLVKANIVPTKISALGIDFSPANQRMLLYILIGITIYFLVAFIIYGLTDFWSYRILDSKEEFLFIASSNIQNKNYSQRMAEIKDKLIAANKVALEKRDKKIKKLNKLIENKLTDLNEVQEGIEVKESIKFEDIEKFADELGNGEKINTEDIRTLLLMGKELFQERYDEVESAKLKLKEISDLETKLNDQDEIDKEIEQADEDANIIYAEAQSLGNELKKVHEKDELYGSKAISRIANIRLLFEFLVPFLVGIFALYTLYVGY